MPALVTSRYVNAYGKAEDPPPTIINTPSGNQDGFVVRYNTDGKPIWSARIGGSGNDVAYTVACDSSNNVYVVGQTGSATRLVIYNVDGTAFSTILPNAGLTDAFVVKYHSSGAVQWVARIASTAADTGQGVAIDSSGNVYVAGQQGAAILTAYNADGTAFGTTLAARTGTDGFLVKYNSSGVVQWNAQVASPGADGITSVAVDPSDNVYVTGSAAGTPITAYNSGGTAFATTLTNTGATDSFLVKYDANGSVLWIAQIGGVSSETANDVTVDSSGNIYVAGIGGGSTGTNTVTFYNSSLVGSGAFSPAMTNAGAGDAFVVKYNSSGTVQWFARGASAGGQDLGKSVRVDSAGNVYMLNVAGNTLYNANNGTAFATLGGLGNGDIYLAKWNSAGAGQWAARFGTTGGDNAFGMAIDNSDNVYIYVNSGTLNTNLTVFNSDTTQFASVAPISAQDTMLIKYNSSGFAQWARIIGSFSSDISYGMTFDKNNNLYLTGTTSTGSAGIYGQTLSLFSTIPNSGGTDAFVVKYNSNGSPQWTARIASTGSDIAYGTTTDPSGNIYVTGQSGSGVVITAYNADGSAFGTTFTSVGNDVFLVKYDPFGTVQWMTYISSSGTDIGYAVATDPSGNIYVTGAGGAGTVTAYSVGASGFSPTLTNAGLGDAFIVKYDTSGVVQWNARISSTAQDIGFGIATDPSGNVYVTGQSGSGATVSVRNANDTVFGTLATLGGIDAYVAKYDTSGTVQWIARIGGTGTDIGNSIFSDSSGNVYVALQGGAATVSAYQGGDGTGASFGSVANAGLGDVVIVKYDTNGTGQWISRCASTQQDWGYSITVDQVGNVYMVGATGNTTFTAFNADGTAFPITLPGGGLTDGFIVKYNSSGVVQWLSRIASGTDDPIYGIAVDKVGNVFVAGWFGSSVGGDTTIFNADTTTFTRFRESAAVIKFNTNGYGQWAVPLRNVVTTGSLTPGSATSRSIACDYFGSIVVVGSSSSGLPIYVYGTDTTIYKLLYVTTGTVSDAYVIKYSAMGIPQWASVIGTRSFADLIYSVATDSSNNVYATGTYGAGTMTLVNGNGSLFTPTLAIQGGSDGIVLKYNPSGTIQWRARIYGGGSEIPVSLTVDSSANVYVTGQGGVVTNTLFSNADDTTTLATLTTTGGVQDAFVVKYNTSGVGQWRFKISSTTVDSGRGIAVDPSGNVYIAGQAGAATFFNFDDTTGGTTTDAGSGDVFVAKYNSSGVFQWVAKVSTASTNADFANGVATDSSGNVYVTGIIGGSTVTVTNSDGSVTLGTMTALSATDQDMFIVKFNTNGFGQWRTRIASTSTGNTDSGRSVAVDPSGNVFVSGQYFGNPSCIFYQADGTTSFLTIGSSGNVGGFVIKYDTNGNPQWVGQIDSSTSTASTDISQVCTTDSAGNVYVTLTGGTALTAFAYNADRSLFGSTMTLPTSAATLTLVKYNSSGAVQWLTSLGTDGANEARALTIDSSGNIIMGGQITSTALVPASS